MSFYLKWLYSLLRRSGARGSAGIMDTYFTYITASRLTHSIDVKNRLHIEYLILSDNIYNSV